MGKLHATAVQPHRGVRDVLEERQLLHVRHLLGDLALVDVAQDPVVVPPADCQKLAIVPGGDGGGAQVTLLQRGLSLHSRGSLDWLHGNILASSIEPCFDQCKMTP
jgi:hypothetical protein